MPPPNNPPYNPQSDIDAAVGSFNEGFTELISPKAAAAYRADRAINSAGVGGASRGLMERNQLLQPNYLARAPRTLAVNPYSATMADQARAAQLALMQQMEAQRQGPSLAAMQGQQALGQSTQQALMQGALGGGRGAMLGAGQAGQGLASDVARARMIEDLKARAGIGGVATGLRGQDIRSAEQQMRTGQQAQGLSDEMARFYASQGQALDKATRDAMLEDFKFRRRALSTEQARAEQGQANTMNTLATIADIIF